MRMVEEDEEGRKKACRWLLLEEEAVGGSNDKSFG